MSEQPFETALEEVERIATDLERGMLSLDDAIERFEEGMGKLAGLRERLDGVEARVRIVLERHGRLIEEPFEQDTEE